MEQHRAHRPVVRRLVAGLIAAITGGVLSFAFATPSWADMPCAVTYNSAFWSPPWVPTPQFEVDATIRNTGSTTSIGWVVYIGLPPGTDVWAHSGVEPMPEYGDGWYPATNATRAIPPGQSAFVIFRGSQPSGVVGK